MSKCWKQEKSSWKRDGFVQPKTARSGCTGQCPVRQAGVCQLAALGKQLTAYDYKSPDCPVVHRTVRWCTGLSGESSTAKSSLSGSVQRRTTIIHWTVRWCTGLSGEPTVDCANGRPRNPRATRGHANGRQGGTGLSGVHRTVYGVPTTAILQWSVVLF